MNGAHENRSRPFHLAFTLALVGIVLCAAGVAGYDLGQRALLVAEDRWADGVIWWEIYFETGFAVGALYFGTMADRVAKRGK